MNLPRPDPAGARARRLLAAVRSRLALRALFAAGLLAGAGLLTFALISAAAIAWGTPKLAALGLRSLGFLPLAAPLAAGAAVLTLARRPGRIYAAVLAERARPQLAGSLVLLAESGAGRIALAPGVAELAAERVETTLEGLSAGEVLRGERRSRAPFAIAGAALALGLVLTAAGRQNFLSALAGRATGRGGVAVGTLPEERKGPAGEVAPASAEVLSITYHYPAYTGLDPRASTSSEIDCLRGARAELAVRTQGDVKSVSLRVEPGDRIAEAQRAPDGDWRVEVPVERVGGYIISLNEDETLRGSITARRDLPPTAAAAVRELPDGRLAIDYRAADDYRLGRAWMVFRAAGREMRFAVPDAAGGRETQGAVLVPREVLAASAEGFSYRLIALDTFEPQPQRGESSELEYRPPQRMADAGPLLEKRMPTMAGPRGGTPPAPAGGAGGAAGGNSTRPLESLYKPGGEDEAQPPPASQEPPPDDDDDYIAPAGGESVKPPPPQSERPGGEGEAPSGGSEEGGEGGAPSGESAEGGEGAGGPGGGTVKTPGGPSSGGGEGGAPGGGAPGGGNPDSDKPPTGSETGEGEPIPEGIIPEKVRMDLEPGERLDPGVAPPRLRTDYGARPGEEGGSSLVPTGGGAPGGEVRVLEPGTPPGGEPGAPTGGPAPVAPQYRRYVDEYLRALADR